jgi:hypothetical protein
LLAFPAVQAISGEPRSEWLLRLALIGLVWVVSLASSLFSSGGQRRPKPNWCWLLLLLVGLVGFLLPTWQYLAVRPLVNQALGMTIGVGLGVWLNAAGHFLVGGISLYELYHHFEDKRKAINRP